MTTSKISSGYCECGCGQRTRIADRTWPKWGWVEGEPVRFVSGHNRSHWKGGRKKTRRGYVQVWLPDSPMAAKGYVLEHRLVVARALGRPLKDDEVVHHINHVRDDNRPENLLACDADYHALIHRRERALDACGNAEWEKCSFCGSYDDPENMHPYRSSNSYYHRSCRKEYDAKRYRRSKDS